MAEENFSNDLSIEDSNVWAELIKAKIEAQKNSLGFSSNAGSNMRIGDQLRGSKDIPNTGAQIGSQVGNISNSKGLSGGKYLDTGKMDNDPRFSPGFLSKVRDICERLNIRFEDLMVAMSFETGGSFSPSKVNRLSGATGLIQFMPSTAAGLERGLTTGKLAAMSQVEQLDYVEKYLKNKNLSGKTFADIYMSILFPVAVSKPGDFVLFGQGAIDGYTGKAYSQNKGLDLNKNGSITKDEAAQQAWDRGIKHLEKYSTSEETFKGQPLDYWKQKYG